jgi:hypothetical protein
MEHQENKNADKLPDDWLPVCVETCLGRNGTHTATVYSVDVSGRNTAPVRQPSHVKAAMSRHAPLLYTV